MKTYYHYRQPRPKKAGWISFTITTNYPVDLTRARSVYKAFWAPGAVVPSCYITDIRGEVIGDGIDFYEAHFIVQGSMARSKTDAPRPGLPNSGVGCAMITVHEHIRHCTNCYKVDHTRHACPHSYCYRCREEGHWPLDCPKKQKSN